MLSNFYEKLFPAFSSKIKIFDGGMGTELERQGAKINDSELWSTKILLGSPSLIKNVHKSFLQNGARIIGTTSYQLSPETLDRFCCDRQKQQRGEKSSSSPASETLDVNTVCQKAVTVAAEAISEFSKLRGENDDDDDQKKKKQSDDPCFIFGCLGSIGSSLPDGKEFSGDYPQECLTGEYMMNFHLERIVALVSNPTVDALLLETQPRLDEVMFVLLKVLPRAFYDAQRSIPIFVSFSAKKDPSTGKIVTGHGDDLETCYSTLLTMSRQSSSSFQALGGVGCNCSSPEVVEEAFQIFAKLYDATRENPDNNNKTESCSCFIGYPNAGEIFDGKTRDWRMPTEEEQRTLGVKAHSSLGEWFASSKIFDDFKRRTDEKKSIKLIIGGCCRTTPERDIASLAKVVMV